MTLDGIVHRTWTFLTTQTVEITSVVACTLRDLVEQTLLIELANKYFK